MHDAARRLEKIQYRIAASESRVIEQELLIARMRTDGEDTTGAVRALDEMIGAKTLLMESMAKEERRTLAAPTTSLKSCHT